MDPVEQLTEDVDMTVTSPAPGDDTGLKDKISPVVSTNAGVASKAANFGAGIAAMQPGSAQLKALKGQFASDEEESHRKGHEEFFGTPYEGKYKPTSPGLIDRAAVKGQLPDLSGPNPLSPEQEALVQQFLAKETDDDRNEREQLASTVGKAAAFGATLALGPAGSTPAAKPQKPSKPPKPKVPNVMKTAVDLTSMPNRFQRGVREGVDDYVGTSPDKRLLLSIIGTMLAGGTAGGLGAGIGGGMGTVAGALRGNTPEGLGRGIIRGGSTGLGSLGGAILGGELGHAVGHGGIGTLAGLGLGGLAGYLGSGELMGEPSGDAKPPQKVQPAAAEKESPLLSQRSDKGKVSPLLSQRSDKGKVSPLLSQRLKAAAFGQKMAMAGALKKKHLL
jgi:hypothetical protein